MYARENDDGAIIEFDTVMPFDLPLNTTLPIFRYYSSKTTLILISTAITRRPISKARASVICKDVGKNTRRKFLHDEISHQNHQFSKLSTWLSERYRHHVYY